MPFVRKRDLLKKNNAQNTANTTQYSSTSNQHQNQHENQQQYHSFYERLMILSDNLSQIDINNWQKQSSEIFSYFYDSRRSLSTIQLLTVYRQSMLLLAKYQLQLKKKGQQINENNASMSLNLFLKILEEVNKLSQDESNDSFMQEAAINKSIFMNLQAFVAIIQLYASKNEKKPTLMRKNSLKKVEQLPTIRPTSRGKLSSLTKRESLTLKQELLPISKAKIQVVDKNVIQDIVLNLCSIVKNLSANARLRKEILKQEYLRLINRYLCIWNDKSLTPTGSGILIQLSSSYRHLAVEQKSHKCFLESNCFDSWARLIEVFPTNQELMFNILRTLSKISNYESCCIKLNEKKACIKNLSSFFKFYKHNIHIIIRIAIIFANMTSYLSDIRHQLYFDFQAWPDIYQCFEFYANRELLGKNQVDKMGLSMAAWDYQHIKKQSDIDCAIRIVRLITNLFTVAPIGQDIYINQSQTYRELVKKLKSILQRKSSIDKWSELIATILSCLTNILFYDKEMLMSNPQHRMIKIQLIHSLVDFVVQIDNEQICCQSLRVIANLTRIKQFCSAVIEAKIHQALFILLDSTSKQIVYYCLGVLTNLITDNTFKQTYKDLIINGVICILNECDNDDFDVVSVALKTLACIVDNRNQNIDPKALANIEACLMNLGNHCDKVLSNIDKDSSEVHECRSLINILLNSMPEEKFICPVKNCGRKFADDGALQVHLKRRHMA